MPLGMQYIILENGLSNITSLCFNSSAISLLFPVLVAPRIEDLYIFYCRMCTLIEVLPATIILHGVLKPSASFSSVIFWTG